MCKKEAYVIRAKIVVASAAMILFPVMGTAGSLHPYPSAAPASKMKKMDQVPPNWSQKLPADQRFELVLDEAAVLDNETGLVWELSPSITYVTWYEAMRTCQNKRVGGRMGWRCPTVEELASLVDPSVSGSDPALPSRHPFKNVQAPFYYWSATSLTLAETSVSAWYVYFGGYGPVVSHHSKASNYYVWCVRGGQGYDGH